MMTCTIMRSDITQSRHIALHESSDDATHVVIETESALVFCDTCDEHEYIDCEHVRIVCDARALLRSLATRDDHAIRARLSESATDDHARRVNVVAFMLYTQQQ
jgi:hypothetical protein